MGKPLSNRQLAAVVAGNALEFYDFLIFSFFAVQLAQVFFPSADKTASLLSTLAIYGAGFLTRPVGGIVIGRLGDRLGRKPAMLFSFALMGLSIVGLALTPSYATIGIAAPALALLFRLMQGFALGGEIGPTTTFLLEAAPSARRGFYVSLQNATQYFAVLCVGLVGLALTHLMAPESFGAYGWRIAMLLGAAIVPFALTLRRGLPETLRHDIRGAAHAHFSVNLLALMLIASVSISTYCMNYLAIYATRTLGLPPQSAFIATVTGGSFAMLGALCGGWLGDRFGRKPVMLAGAAALVLLSVPCFMAMLAWRTTASLVLNTVPLAFFIGLFPPPALANITESFPAAHRSGALGLVYALGVAIFGGSAQFIVTWLMQWTGSPLAPAIYMAGAVALGLGGMLAMRETAPVKTGEIQE
jgi:MHS family citrate/tricarballylate:H+ symporter-like MFS transporter